MRLSDISETMLKYGDKVQIKDENSKYVDIEGKIIAINSFYAEVKFKGKKKAVSLMLDALEKL